MQKRLLRLYTRSLSFTTNGDVNNEKRDFSIIVEKSLFVYINVEIKSTQKR